MKDVQPQIKRLGIERGTDKRAELDVLGSLGEKADRGTLSVLL